jgi:murein DD-endopeptidase MepM/ murein hydrolase activator NlpD
MSPRRVHLNLVIVIASSALLSGCAPIREVIRPASPYEQYASSLRSSGLDQTALGRDWLNAGTMALSDAMAVELPFQESGYLFPDEARALAWSFPLARGRRLVVAVEIQAEQPFHVYLDLFEMTGNPPEPRHVDSGEDGGSRLEFEAERDGIFVLRLQPELLRGGRFTITEQTTASLTFPVDGADSRSVQSFFGDPRDTGGREHHGVDIFAARGTPALAAADGWVRTVGLDNLGGNVVWIWAPDRGQSHYYAHLDEQLVSEGRRVNAGDPIGRVGNTGNARGTSPHLHFGIYDRGDGPVDPFPFINNRTAMPPRVTADMEAFGSWRRVSAATVRLREGSGTSSVVAELPRHTAFRVEGAVRDDYRVRLPDQTHGFLAARSTESISRPVRTARADTVLDRPAPTAVAMYTFPEDASLPVLGRFGDFLYVQTPQGRPGWITPPRR